MAWILYLDKDFRTSKSGQSLSEKRAAVSLDRVSLKCRHELENISAAALATLVAGGTLTGIHKALEAFRGLPHRMERVADLDGIVFYNDSKATNVDAVQRAIECLQGPIHLIMGGRDKGWAVSFARIVYPAEGQEPDPVWVRHRRNQGRSGEPDHHPNRRDHARCRLVRACRGIFGGGGSSVTRMCQFRYVSRLQGTR